MEEIQRDEMPVDVLFVGAGPGNLLSAWHLMRQMKAHNADVEKGVKQGKPFPLDEMTIMVIEKGAEVGAHNFSGAVLDPISIQEVMPDWLERGAPIEGRVDDDAVMFLTEGSALKLPITPPPLENHGNYVISLSKICRWLGKLCEEEGVQIYPGFPGVKVLFDEDKRVKGVQTGDKGLDPDGNPKDNFEPGILLTAKVTVFGEGPRGNLMKQLEQTLGIAKGKNPQSYEMGVKEIFELPEGHGRFKAGQVWHTMGYPLSMFGRTFGGGFIYGMAENRLAVGMVVDLHSPDPYLDAHRELAKLKAHPWVSGLLEGGKVVQYGGKALAIGGFHSMPKLSFAGGLVLGDAASMLNGQRLKGIHTSMKAGVLVAETILDCMIKEDFSARQLAAYDDKVKNSFIHKELYGVRNFHGAFDDGVLWGFIKSGMQFALGLFNADHASEEDHLRTKEVSIMHPGPSASTALVSGVKVDGKKFLDKLTDAYLSGTKHEEKQPSHLRLADPDKCATCWELYKSPCTRFCPVQVYELPEDVQSQVQARLGGKPVPADAPRHASLTQKHIQMPGEHDRGVGDGHGKSVPGQQWPNQLLHINFTNCIHCKTCDIKCPYLNLAWTPPEGGGGPAYTLT